MRWIEAPAVLGLLVGTGLAQTAQQPPGKGPLPQAPALPPIAAPAPMAPVEPPRFVVVLDAAHGGSDTGAKIGPGILEKDITLELAGRLRSVLKARGVDVVMTRQTDTDVSALDQAETANHAQAGACLVVHATATGSGVHLYTSSLGPTPRTAFLPWATAQSAYVTQSLKLESEIDSALVHTSIPVTMGRASVEPMDKLACPEVAVEMAPLVAGHVTTARPLTDVSYQKQVVDALAAALEQWRSDGRNP